jgi:metallo-beta-lactamase family protein
MLGSASIQLLVQEDSKRRSVIFSGDFGPKGVPMLRHFEPFQHADLVFLESTYGNPFEETVDEFVHFVNNAVSGGGKVLVPTFAVGRVQLLIGLLG